MVTSFRSSALRWAIILVVALLVALAIGQLTGLDGVALGAMAFPARLFMRPQRYDRGTQTFTLGGNAVTFKLRQLNYLEALIVHLTGTYTVATAALVFLGLQPYNIVRSFLMKVPGNPMPVFNLGGAAMHVWNLRNDDFAPGRKQFRFPAQGTLDANAYHASLVDQFATALGAQTFHLWWVLPLARSATDVQGVIPLGNREEIELEIYPAAAADIVTVPANLTVPVFTVQVTQLTLTPPPAGSPAAGVDTTQLITYDERFQQVQAVGLQTIEISPSYEILGVLHGLILNNLMNSADVTDWTLRLNGSYMPNDPGGVPGAVIDMIQAYQQGLPLPVGWLMYDGDVLGKGVESIRTAAITELESRITIAATATLGAVAGVNPRIYTSTRRLVPLAA